MLLPIKTILIIRWLRFVTKVNKDHWPFYVLSCLDNQLHFNSCLLILKIAEMLKLQIVIAISCWCNFLKCQKRISILVWPAFSISIVFLELPTIPLFISFEVFKVRVGKKTLKDNFYWDKYVVTSCLLNKRFVNCCENMYKMFKV